MTFSNHAAKKPTRFNNLSDATAWNQARTEERRAQRKLEREADPEWAEVRRIRQEIADRERAEKAAKEGEASRHTMIGWPGGLGAHVDRGAARAKASFIPYLQQAVEQYERDHPDQAPTPARNDDVDDVLYHRDLESRARARRLMEDGVELVEKAKMLEVRHSYIGDQEFSARLAVRQQLQGAADPLGDHEPLVGEDTTAPTPAPVESEPPKRGRGRPSKAAKNIEMTDDGAMFEDDE